jgi:hypothetical protein
MPLKENPLIDVKKIVERGNFLSNMKFIKNQKKRVNDILVLEAIIKLT